MNTKKTNERSIPFECFPNYTWEMYNGNEPAGKGHELVSGGYADRWDCRYGDAETVGGKILHASFNITPKVRLYLHHDSLYIIDVRYSGKPDFWELCVNCSGLPGFPCVCESSRHTLEQERIEFYLNKEFPNCLLWDMVNARARELYEHYLKRGGSIGVPQST
jgi:hypothetical protein